MPFFSSFENVGDASDSTFESASFDVLCKLYLCEQSNLIKFSYRLTEKALNRSTLE